MSAEKLISEASTADILLSAKRKDDRIRSLLQDNKELTERLDRAEQRTALRNCLSSAPELKARQLRQGSGKREAVPMIMVSDLHLEETITAASVNGLNSFDLKIAEARMLKLAESIAWEITHERHAFHINQVVVLLMGDIISGEIHEDLMASNGLGLSQAIKFARGLLIRLLKQVLSLDVDVTVICVDGNHGRLTKKPRVATRMDVSIELVLYDSMAEALAGEKRIKFVLPEGIMTYQTVFGTRCRVTHGDAVKYGGGVGGIMIPINKAIAQWDKSIQADHTFMGHWHQRITSRRASVNGSLPGYGAYALWIKAEPEPPMQGMVLVDSKRGICHPKDLWVASSDEGKKK